MGSLKINEKKIDVKLVPLTVKYTHIYVFFFFQVVAPKKANLAEAEASLAETMKILNAKREELAEVEAKLANLKLTFAEMTDKKQQLEFQVRKDVYLCND